MRCCVKDVCPEFVSRTHIDAASKSVAYDATKFETHCERSDATERLVTLCDMLQEQRVFALGAVAPSMESYHHSFCASSSSSRSL